MPTAFLGPTGSLSHDAALQVAARGVVDDELVAYPSITSAMDAVEDGTLAWAVVPFEDAIIGGVIEAVDHLVQDSTKGLVHGIVEVAAELFLAVPDGVTLDDITTVASHPLALAQCADHLRGLGITLLEGVGSTSLACTQVAASGRRDMAALASVRAADQAGLTILAEELNDGEDHHVAFAVVGSAKPVHHESGKVLLFAVPGRNRPGAVHELLAPFAVRHLNLSRLESRPLSREFGEYGFLLECDGGLEDPDLRSAVSELLEERTTVKLLGAYPSVDHRWGRVKQKELRGRVADRPSQLDDLLGPAASASGEA